MSRGGGEFPRRGFDFTADAAFIAQQESAVNVAAVRRSCRQALGKGGRRVRERAKKRASSQRGDDAVCQTSRPVKAVNAECTSAT